MALKSRVARLLAGGIKAALIPTITGVPLLQLQTWLKDEEFKAQVEYFSLGGDPELEPKTDAEQAMAEEITYQDRLKISEIAALSAVMERVNEGLMEDRTVLNAFQVISQRRDALAKQEALNRALTQGAEAAQRPTVVINLPSITVPELNISSQSEVVGIGDRSTVPMARDQLTALIEGELAHEQLSKAGAPSSS